MVYDIIYSFQNPFSYTGMNHMKNIVEEPIEKKQIHIPHFPGKIVKSKFILNGRIKCNCGMLSCICY